MPAPPRSTLFPYTTLFRSRIEHVHVHVDVDDIGEAFEPLHLGCDARRSRLDVLDRQALDGRAVEQVLLERVQVAGPGEEDRKSTRLNSSHTVISYAVFCLK